MKFWILALVAVLGLGQISALAADEETYDETTLSSSSSSETSVRKPPPEVHAGLDLQYSNAVFPHYRMSDSAVGTKGGHLAQLSVEWLPFSNRIGKLGIGAGIGYFFLNKTDVGNGRRETISVYPVRGFLSYRADYVHNQIVVPFAKVGLTAAWLNQTGTPGMKRFDGFDYGGGLELCLNKLDPSSSMALDQSTGIHGTYFVAEYTKTGFLDEQRAADLTHDEVRFGLRFEM